VAYNGTVRLFEDAGFEVVARRRANRISPEQPIMRKARAPHTSVEGPIASATP